MSLDEKYKIQTNSPLLYLDVYRGHFATSHSHINYYIDITPQKSRLSEATAVAKALAGNYKNNTVVDTVLSLDGTEVIATLLARELTESDFYGVNSGKPINVLTPEYTSGSQLFFRDNIKPMVEGKCVLVLAASLVTGFTAKSAIEAINYYGGRITGICSIFSTQSHASDGTPIFSVFNPHDLPGYASYTPLGCPMCRNKERIEALVNQYGCSKL